jgi:putative transcriptional regulator
MGPRLLTNLLCVPFTVGVCLGPSSSMPDASWRTRVAVSRRQPGSPVHLARGHLLVASRRLIEPNFAETVVLLLHADAHGAMGVVINRPTKVKLAEVLPNLKELRRRPDRVFLGGPVGGNVMVVLIRAHKKPTQSENIVDDVYATGSMTALREALGRKGKTDRLRAYAGYAGWGPGQLEHEIWRGDWLVGSGDAATIFDLSPADIWPKLIERLSGTWTRNDAGTGAGNPVPPS